MIKEIRLHNNFFLTHEKETFMMTYQIIYIYCLCEEFVKAIGLKDDPQTKMSNAEIMTFAIVAARYFHGNYATTRLFFLSHHYFRNLIGKSRLNKRLLRIP